MDDPVPPRLAAVAAYYNQQAENEWQRLERHRTEFAVTLKALAAHLPPPPARVLDCGGGPGRYSIELAHQGYEVTLFDLSSENLNFARRMAAQAGVRLSAYEQGTATDLSRFGEDSFDAMLLMGPLYHLLTQEERQQALSEAKRVLKPGGCLFAAFISRYAPFRYAAAEQPGILVERAEEARSILVTGAYPVPPGDQPAFQAYYTHPTELAPLFQENGLDLITILAAEGLVSRSGEQTMNALSGATWEAWADLNYQVASDPSIHGAAEHLLAVAVKPCWRTALQQVVQRLEQAGVKYKVVGGTSAALHGVPVQVKDVDIETDAEEAYLIAQLFAAQIVQPVSLSESPSYRSHFGRLVIEGVPVEVMGDLQRWEEGRWVDTRTRTETQAVLDGVRVRVSWLEEETLAYIRRGRMDRAALCLQRCDPQKLLALIRGDIESTVISRRRTPPQGARGRRG